MTAPVLLDASGLDVKVSGRTLIEGLDLRVARGEVACILGPNGAGKSLTLHTLAGLRPPAAGTVALCGRPLEAWARR